MISINLRRSAVEEALARQLETLGRLESDLAQRELDLATLEADLAVFEQQYRRIVARQYARFDALQAQIAAIIAAHRPEDRAAQARAREAHAKERQTAREAQTSFPPPSGEEPTPDFAPSESLKRLFRDLAKRFHPDLTTDAGERDRRHELMSEVNRLYRLGDEAGLGRLLALYETRPEAARGDSVAAELARTVGKVAAARARLAVIDGELELLRGDPMARLREQVVAAARGGVDLLAGMADEVRRETEGLLAALERLLEGSG